MNILSKILSIIMLLVAILTGLMAILLHDNDIVLYENVAHAYSYICAILLSLYISFELLRKDN